MFKEQRFLQSEELDFNYDSNGRKRIVANQGGILHLIMIIIEPVVIQAIFQRPSKCFDPSTPITLTKMNSHVRISTRLY